MTNEWNVIQLIVDQSLLYAGQKNDHNITITVLNNLQK